MQNDFKLRSDLTFMDVETGKCAGWVKPLKGGKGFAVHRAMTNGYEQNRIAVVKSIGDASPALTTYYDEHPPRWKRTRNGRHDGNAGYTMYTEFIKWSFYGVFTVKQQDDGLWVASRCTDALLLDGKEAIFSTAEVAKYVADLHERDGFGNFPAIDDGFSWDGRPWIVTGAYQTNG